MSTAGHALVPTSTVIGRENIWPTCELMMNFSSKIPYICSFKTIAATLKIDSARNYTLVRKTLLFKTGLKYGLLGFLSLLPTHSPHCAVLEYKRFQNRAITLKNLQSGHASALTGLCT